MGCGAAFSTMSIAESLRNGTTVVGCDIDFTLLQLAADRHVTGRGGFHLICSGEPGLAFPDGAFDVVFSEGALHHIDNAAEALKEMWRVLRPGGLLLIVDLNPDAVAAKLFIIYAKIKKLLGLATPGDTALAHSIKEALTPSTAKVMFSHAGIPFSASATIASIRYRAIKPGGKPIIK